MRVDADDVLPFPSSTTHDKTLLFLVVVATLASFALLIFSLRMYMCGRILRTFGIDDWIALVAALSTIGVLTTFACLINQGSGKRSRIEAYENSRASRNNAWLWLLSLFHIIGIGCVKLSVTAYLLRVFERRYCCYLLYGLAGLLVASTFAWFGSVLLRCLPVSAGWTLYSRSGARCMSSSTYTTLDFINNTINAGTDITIVTLLLPILCGPAVKFAIRAYLTVVLCLGMIACTAAIIQTHETHKHWKSGEYNRNHGILFTVWSIIELTTALTASCIPSLFSLSKSLVRTHPPQLTSNGNPSPSTISLPQTAYLPTSTPTSTSTSTSTLTRYHDSISHLDFDIETPISRTRTHTLQSRGIHSRNASDWSQFSGLAYYTNPAVGLEGEGVEIVGIV